MSCDYIVIFLFGLACSLCFDEAQAYVPGQMTYEQFGLSGIQPVYKQHRHRLVRYPLIRPRPISYNKNPFREGEADVLNYKPFYGGHMMFKRQIYNEPNIDVVYLKVPKEKVLSMLSNDELALLYEQKLAYDVPIENSSGPQEIAISSAFVKNLMNVTGGLGESAQGVTGFAGGLLHAGGAVLGTLGETARHVGNFFWTNQG